MERERKKRMDLNEPTFSEPIGRIVYTSFGCLKMGTIVDANLSGCPAYYKIVYEDEQVHTVTPAFVHFTPQDAMKACEENAEYWANKAQQIEKDLTAD